MSDQPNVKEPKPITIPIEAIRLAINPQSEDRDLESQHLDLHGRMICLIEDMLEAINGVQDASLRSSLSIDIRRLAELRMDAEFIAMGPEWSRYYMEENYWETKDIKETLQRLFGEGVEA